MSKSIKFLPFGLKAMTILIHMITICDYHHHHQGHGNDHHRRHHHERTLQFQEGGQPHQSDHCWSESGPALLWHRAPGTWSCSQLVPQSLRYNWWSVKILNMDKLTLTKDGENIGYWPVHLELGSISNDLAKAILSPKRSTWNRTSSSVSLLPLLAIHLASTW